jgi:hypothetical protein
MAKPIISIPVDSTAFNDFVEKFEKFRASVGESSDDWSGTKDSVSDISEIYEKLVSNADKRSSAEKETNEALDKQKKTLEAIKDIEGKRNRGNEKWLNDLKSVGKTTGSFLEGIGRVIGGGAIAGMAAIAGAGIGLDILAEKITGQRRAATGVGLSIGEMAGLKGTFGPGLGDISGTLDAINTLRQSAEGQGVFATTGVDTKGKGSKQLFLDEAMAAGRMMNRLRGNPAALDIMKARGFGQFFSDQQMTILGERYKTGELAKTTEEAQKDIKSGKMEVSPEAAAGWEKFTRLIEKTGYAIENSLGQALVKLTPLLEKFVSVVTAVLPVLTDFLTSLLNIINTINDFIDSIGKALSDLNKFFGGKETTKGPFGITSRQDIISQQDKRDKADQARTDKLAKSVQTQQKTLDKVLPTQKAPQAPIKAFQPPIKPVIALPRALIPTAPEVAPMAPQTPLAAPKEPGVAGRLGQLTSFFAGKGYDANAITAFAKDLMGENRSLNPFEWEKLKGGGRGVGYGIAQWGVSRRKAFEQWAGHKMTDTKDPQRALEEQLKFFMAEIMGQVKGEGGFGKGGFGINIRKGESFEEILRDLVTRYERPRDPGYAYKQRLNIPFHVQVALSSPGGVPVSVKARAVPAGQTVKRTA